EPQDLCKNPRALPHFLPPIPLQKSMDGLRMVRSRVGQRILNQPARHGARSSGSRGGPESDRRAGLAWRRGHHAAPTFDEERKRRDASIKSSEATKNFPDASMKNSETTKNLPDASIEM